MAVSTELPELLPVLFLLPGPRFFLAIPAVPEALPLPLNLFLQKEPRLDCEPEFLPGAFLAVFEYVGICDPETVSALTEHYMSTYLVD